jgi:hypothetical protein
MLHYYRAFGLSVESALPCPELLPAELTPHPDVRIRYGDVPERLEGAIESGPRWQVAPGRYLLNAGAAARYYVHSGHEIVVDPSHTLADDVLRAVLLGTGMSILLHQRGLLPLHCGAIETDRGAVVFAGGSGAGKSTLVAAFLQRGFKILADDMLALEPLGDGEVAAFPGFPHVRLWADSAQALGRSTQGLQRVSPGVDKFLSPEPGSFCSSPRRLHAIYTLGVGDDPLPRLEPQGHSAKFNSVLNNTWQKSILTGLGVRQRHFEMAAGIAATTYGACLVRPSQPRQIPQVVDLIAHDMELEHGPV